jgi:dTDP-4-dehydrorhamnose reductase
MKHILITGANGQLGTSLKEHSRDYNQFSYTFADIPDLDLTNEPKVRQFFENNKIDYIINCAGYTAVDQAEKQPEQAFSINAGIPLLLGKICLERSMFLIHLSTDYVYDGRSSQPHSEGETPKALSVYAQSKLKGEMHLWKNKQSIIIRTSWLYSEYGNNFLRTMLRLSKEKKELGVVFDQVGTPTYAGDLANTLLSIIVHSESHGFKAGIYNYSNEGVCSWYDFAVEIMQMAGTNCVVKPIRTSEYSLPAQRPEFSVMDKSKIRTAYGISISHWKQGLLKAIGNLKKKEEI